MPRPASSASAPTGHAVARRRRRARREPEQLSTLPPAGAAASDLLAEFPEAILVTELIGQGVNGVTGDYSRGAAGFMVRGGEIAEPVAEITIASNLKEMFATLEPGSRPGIPPRHRLRRPCWSPK